MLLLNLRRRNKNKYTYMINNGIDVKVVSEHLGHCNIAITADTYGHIFEEYKKRIAKCLEDDLI